MIEFLFIICILLAGCIVYLVTMLILSKRKYKQMVIEYNRVNQQLSIMSSDYSDKMLKYIRDFTAQLTVLMFNEFIDSHDVDKINKAQIENLISNISNEVYQSLNLELIQFDRALFTKRYLETYIIKTVVNDVKNLWNKTLST